MKSASGFLLLCVSLVLAAQARATVLPDACGDDKIKFDVKTEKGRPAPAPPGADMAQIVFIEILEQPGNARTILNVTTRFGVDGAWVGAARDMSYFTVPVTPGVHHLCVNWQAIGPNKKYVGVDSFNADPGHVYYYRVKISDKANFALPASGPGVTGGGGIQSDLSFDFARLSDDEGRYMVKVSSFATATPKK